MLINIIQKVHDIAPTEHHMIAGMVVVIIAIVIWDFITTKG